MYKTFKKVNLFIQEEILVVSSFLMFALIAAGAVARVVFKTDFYGQEEVVMLFAFWQYFIGTSMAGHEDSHIEADMIRPYLKSERAKHILTVIKYTLSLALCIMTTVWCFQMIGWYLDTKPVTSIFRIPMAISECQ